MFYRDFKNGGNYEGSEKVKHAGARLILPVGLIDNNVAIFSCLISSLKFIKKVNFGNRYKYSLLTVAIVIKKCNLRLVVFFISILYNRER